MSTNEPKRAYAARRPELIPPVLMRQITATEEEIMSLETMEHLNTQTVIGFENSRGKAWHWRRDLQTPWSVTMPDGRVLEGVGNHYPDAVPVDHVKQRLFNWTPESRRVAVELPATFENMTHLSDEGLPLRWAVQSDLQAITRDDVRLGLFTQNYRIHHFDVWLIDLVEKILGEGLGISSAGLLKGGAIAWVEVSVPDTIQTPEGIEFRPNLLATTTLDGSLATTYKRTAQLTVCDNTRNIALGEDSPELKVRHSSRSLGKLSDVRAALAMVENTAMVAADQFTAEATTKVTTPQFERVVELVVPFDENGSKRGQTIATTKREQLLALWHSDPRVTPWTGTAFGVAQAFNTWNHHLKGGLPKGDDGERLIARAERNTLHAIDGTTGKADAEIAKVLATVLA